MKLSSKLIIYVVLLGAATFCADFLLELIHPTQRFQVVGNLGENSFDFQENILKILYSPINGFFRVVLGSLWWAFSIFHVILLLGAMLFSPDLIQELRGWYAMFELLGGPTWLLLIVLWRKSMHKDSLFGSKARLLFTQYFLVFLLFVLCDTAAH